MSHPFLYGGEQLPELPARPKSSSRIESKRPSAAASWAIARFTSPISDAARFAGRHRPYLVFSTKFSRASKMHNRMLNSLGLFSLVYRLQLWSIRGTIHLENDDSWINPRPSQRIGRTRRYCSAARRLGYRPRATEATVKIMYNGWVLSGAAHNRAADLRPLTSFIGPYFLVLTFYLVVSSVIKLRCQSL